MHMHTITCSHTHTHSVFHANQNHSPPPGHVALAFSLRGRSADLSRSGRSQSFLTLKHGLMFGHNNAITGLCVIGKVDLMRY